MWRGPLASPTFALLEADRFNRRWQACRITGVGLIASRSFD
jgi:hypothetical protein